MLRLLAAIGVVATLAACAQASPVAAPDGVVTVVTSTNVWASVVQAVGGDKVSVKSVVTDPAGDPHSYQVSAKDAAELRGAELVVFNGGGYDPFVEQAIGAGGPRMIKAFDLRPARHGTDDEHVWYDLPTVAMVAGEVAAQLSQLRPADKATFVANADAFDAKLDGLESRLGELATAHRGKAVAATEPVAHYLLDAVQLTDTTPAEFTEAVEEETDPPAASVAQIQQLVTERRVALLVHNPQTETPMVAALIASARAAGLPVVEMTETVPNGQDYLTWMGSQIDALSAALRP